MEEKNNDNNDSDDTIIDTEFILPLLKDSNSNQKIISLITEYMSLPLNEKTTRYLVNKNIRNIKNPVTSDLLLHYLCKNDDNFSLLKLINPNQVEKEQKNNLGQTLLHIAVKNKCYKISKYLIESGINLQLKDNNNNTPLHIATKNGDYNIVKLIMKYNPKLNILNNNKETPLDIAFKKNDKILINLLNNKENNDKIDNKIINRRIKKEYSYRGNNADKSTKSNICGSSTNNFSLDTKNETDNQSLNIYRKKIVSKDSKKIKCNKTIIKNSKFNDDISSTPDKKISFNSFNHLSPLVSKARIIYRKTSPKLIKNNMDSYIEFNNDSNLEEYEYNLKKLSPRKTGNISCFSDKKGESKLINKSNIIKIESINNHRLDLEPKVKVIEYDKLKDNRVKSQKNNYSYLGLKNLESNKYNIKKVRNTIIQNTPFVSFKKQKKKKEELNQEKLLEFLKEIGMQQYGNILISEGFDDINLILKQMKEGFPILDDSLKELGISYPGDRAKILIRMQQVSGGFDFDFPFEQVFFKNNLSIQRWLNKEGFPKYIHNFIDAGYQSLELLLIQMASKYKINEKILKNEIFIIDDEDRISILKSLENNSEKYVYELRKKGYVQRTFSKMVNNKSDYFCNIM